MVQITSWTPLVDRGVRGPSTHCQGHLPPALSYFTHYSPLSIQNAFTNRVVSGPFTMLEETKAQTKKPLAQAHVEILQDS